MKALALAIAAFAAVAFAAGCGGGDGGGTASATGSSNRGATGSSAPKASEPAATGPTESGSPKATGSHEPGEVESNAVPGATPQWVKIDKTRPKVTAPGGTPPKKLVVNDLEEGTGPPAKYGDEVTIMYAGRFYNGEDFSASWDWGKPTTFELGGGSQDAGWETGVEGMRVGGRRELIVPGGYRGKYGFPPGSGPEDTLVYVIDLFAID